MSTSTDEIKIDLDDIDAKKAAAAAKSDAKGAKDDEIIVEPAAKEAKSDAKPIVSVEEGLEKLKKQLADEQTARADAERRAREAAEGEARAKTEVQTSQLDLVTNAIATVKQSQKSLRTEYAAAMAAQDFEKVAEIQESMSDNSARLLQLENGKTALEKAPKPQIRVPEDPVERFAAQLTPRSAAWVRAHPEFVRDEKKNRQMLNAHAMALDEGITADTDAYFAHIEHSLRIPRADPMLSDSEPAALSDASRPTSTRSAPPAAAPPSRSGNGSGSRPNVVRLSAEQREIAKLNGMSDEEYAREIVELRKEGKLN